MTPATRPRPVAVGRWVESLASSDVNSIWAELHRVVCRHPLVRASRSADLLIQQGVRGSAYADLTQELFVVLLSKDRFQHYLDTEMTDAEIECEIGQIELTNLLTAELRKRHPESYRLARRISTVIQSSAKFRLREEITLGNAGKRHCRLGQRVYGLSKWSEDKPQRSQLEFEERVRQISVRQRDKRMVGRTGDVQIIISNSDLENLVVSVLDVCDSFIDVRTLRSLVMSRLPVMDIYLVPLCDEDSEGGKVFEPMDRNQTPEQVLLQRESETEHASFVERFLKELLARVRGKGKQYDRMLSVLWHCYLSTPHRTQIEVAAMLGVSDSLVSDYRRRIEEELHLLSLPGLEEARSFEASLRRRLMRMRTYESPVTQGVITPWAA